MPRGNFRETDFSFVVRNEPTTVRTQRFFPLGDALIRFAPDTADVGVTCAADACTVIDVVNGRRTQSRTLARGREAMLSLHANTLISAARN